MTGLKYETAVLLAKKQGELGVIVIYVERRDTNLIQLYRASLKYKVRMETNNKLAAVEVRVGESRTVYNMCVIWLFGLSSLLRDIPSLIVNQLRMKTRHSPRIAQDGLKHSS